VVFVSIRTAALEDLPAIRRVFRRASLSNDGDREVLLTNPAALELPDRNVIEGRTRLATSFRRYGRRLRDRSPSH
jgi:hypothetical protein